MADSVQQLKDDECITARQSTAITLQYPSIPVNGTPESWLSSSLLVPMAPNHDEGSVRSNDDTMSSLDDSTYDLVDDASVATTDDEEQSRMTDSVSVTGRITLEEPENKDLERTLFGDDVKTRPFDSCAQDGDGMQSFVSSSTTGPDDASPDISPKTPREQQIDKQSPPDVGTIQFREIRHSEAIHQLESSALPKHLTGTVRQHVADQNLFIDGPYKLLYVGDMAGREAAINKIGAALASTAGADSFGPLRYSVVPMPSSDDPSYLTDPILLDWSGHGMAVYHCIDASFHRTDSGHDTIDLTMDGDAHIKSSWDSAKFSVTGDWETPDIAIFYLSDTDNVSVRQTRRFARSFMARHNIPSIVIAEKPSWNRPSETMAIDHRTPHVCLQIKNDAATSSRIVKRLPIDLLTFSRLNALQLNRNLAYLHTTYGAPRITDEQKNKLSIRDPESYRSKFTQLCLDNNLAMPPTRLPYLRDILAAAVTCLILSFLVPQLFTFGPHSITGSPIPRTTSSYSLASSMATSKASLQVKPTALQSLPTPGLDEARITRSVTNTKSHTDLATLFLESSPIPVNKSGKFQIHVLGRTHIILRPPHWFTRLRKTPKLKFNIAQGDRVLEHEVSALFDGVYALELMKDDAYGTMNITVWTTSKPKLHETLQADFGNLWLRAAGWKKATRALSTSFWRDLDLVQASMGAAYIQSGAELHLLMKKTLARAQDLRNETQAVGKTAASLLAKIYGLVPTVPKVSVSQSSLLHSFEEKKSMAADEISARTAHFLQSVSSYLSNKARLAHLYAHATPTMYRVHLRNTQKRALRMWWSIVGLPKQRPVSVIASGKSRASHGGKHKKQFVNT